MAAPKFTPVPANDEVRSYHSPDVVPDPWMSNRPGDLQGSQPRGPLLGYQGPDQGYAIRLANRLRPHLVLSDAEDPDDVVAGATAIAMRRASLYGRAPVIHDLRIALTVWGFLDPAPPTELVDLRVERFERASDPHHYDAGRALADAVPESTLRSSPDEVSRAYPSQWRELIGITE